MLTATKRTSLNFTSESWAKKLATIQSGKKIITYYLPNPNAARLSKLSDGDAVILTGRRIGPQATAVVKKNGVSRDSSGIHVLLKDVVLL